MKDKKIVPRPYQAIAIPDCVKALQTFGKTLCVMATGLGKTFTSAFIAKEFGAKRILFLVHNNFILAHAKDEFVQVFGKHVPMSLYNGIEKKGAENASIVFATWQTMRENLDSWKKSHFDLLIVDEAHHADAATWRPVVEYFSGPRLALTATPPEPGDKKDIRDLFGPEVVNVTREEAIARGWLPRIEYHVITDKSLDEDALQEIVGEIRQSKKRFTMAEVNRRIFIRQRDGEIAKIINGYDEKAIVFCPNIPYADRFAKLLKLCETFHSSKKGENGKGNSHTENKRVLKQLHSGILRRVCAVDAFNEGVNVPSVGLVAFCRCTESMRIFSQQLGRGMRPGKEKLIVLDFVGNLERIKLVSEMVRKIADFHEKFSTEEEQEREGYKREKFEVSGAGFEFTFSDKIVDLIEVMRHCQREFYLSWKESGEAAQKLGIKNAAGYQADYKLDSCLPSHPDQFYSDFPGWGQFLGTGNLYTKPFYPTWKKASVAARKLGISSASEYSLKYKADPLLASRPHVYYEDFPGWPKFLGSQNSSKDFYPTIQEAAKAAGKLGISSADDYFRLYKTDPRLPCEPQVQYPDFSGWKKFLGTDRYSTWRQGTKAAVALGISSVEEYRKRYREDKRLPSSPNKHYEDFPGWPVFLGKTS